MWKTKTPWNKRHLRNTEEPSMLLIFPPVFCLLEQNYFGSDDFQRGPLQTVPWREAGEHHQRGGADGRLLVHAGRPPGANRGRVQRRAAGPAGSAQRVYEQRKSDVLITGFFFESWLNLSESHGRTSTKAVMRLCASSKGIHTLCKLFNFLILMIFELFNFLISCRRLTDVWYNQKLTGVILSASYSMLPIASEFLFTL